MKSLKKTADALASLRKKAEKQLREQQERIQELSAKGVLDLVQELGTHQIELEMQVEELQRAQAELEASRNNFADLYDFSPIGYFTFDTSRVIREVNLTAAKMLGIERRYLVSKPFSAFVSKDDSGAFRLHYDAVAADRTRETIELRLKRRDKTEFFALLESIAVVDPEGNTTAVRTAVSDITDRKKAEEAPQQSELRYRLLAENMLDGYAYCKMLYDDRGRPADFVYLSVNRAFERLTGLKNVVNRKVTDIIPGIRGSQPDVLEICGRVAATGRTEKFETEFKPLGMWLTIAVYSTERDHFTAVFDNITERKDAARVLGASEEKYRLLFESMAEGFALNELLYDDQGRPADWRVLEVNDAYSRHTGISREAIVGRRMSELFPEAIAEYLPQFAEVVARQGSVEFEAFSKRTNLYQQVVSFPAGPHRFASTITDITVRKRAEEALRTSEQRLTLFIEYAPASLAMFDRDMRYLSVSRRWLSDYGLRDRDVRGLLHYDVFPEITERWKAIHRRALAGEVVREESDRFDRADGSVQWLRWEVHPWHDSTGALAGLVVFSEDITERKRAAEALRESEKQFRTLADSIPNLAWWANADGYITWYNQRWYEYTGTAPAQMEGWGWQSVHDPEVLPKVLDRWKASIATGKPFDMEFPLRGADGVFRSFLTRVLPLKGPDGQVLRWFGTNTDVSALKLAEEALKQSNAELAVANSDLEAFSYAVSHDLRAPLRAIEGFTTAIIEDHGASLNESAKDHFNRVVSASRRMSQLIDAMLNMARLTKGEMREKTVDLSGLAEIAAHELRKRDPGRSADFVIAPGLKAQGDREMLNTVVENLLDNAWKFTGKHPAATIEFGASESNGKMVFFVRDDGAGFDVQFADKLFMPFHRFHSSGEFPGLGIGLAIVHSIIARHNGRIWAESAQEKGATFFFTL